VDPFTPLIGVASRVVETLYDRFEASHSVRLGLSPAIVGYWGSTEAHILLTVRNRRGEPQRVEEVALRLSNGQFILMPIESKIVTMTDPYVGAFALENVKAATAEERRGTGQPVYIVGARVRLASGPAVTLRKRIEVDQEAPLQLGGGRA
jgi:hypothetical protein